MGFNMPGMIRERAIYFFEASWIRKISDVLKCIRFDATVDLAGIERTISSVYYNKSLQNVLIPNADQMVEGK